MVGTVSAVSFTGDHGNIWRCNALAMFRCRMEQPLSHCSALRNHLSRLFVFVFRGRLHPGRRPAVRRATAIVSAQRANELDVLNPVPHRSVVNDLFDECTESRREHERWVFRNAVGGGRGCGLEPIVIERG